MISNFQKQLLNIGSPTAWQVKLGDLIVQFQETTETLVVVGEALIDIDGKVDDLDGVLAEDYIPKYIYPNDGSTVDIVTSATAKTFGDFVEVVPANAIGVPNEVKVVSYTYADGEADTLVVEGDYSSLASAYLVIIGDESNTVGFQVDTATYDEEEDTTEIVSVETDASDLELVADDIVYFASDSEGAVILLAGKDYIVPIVNIADIDKNDTYIVELHVVDNTDLQESVEYLTSFSVTKNADLTQGIPINIGKILVEGGARLGARALKGTATAGTININVSYYQK